MGTTQTNLATAVSNGLFAVTLDFGASVFNGPSYWVQIGARTNGSANFTNLSPLLPITPTPYAIAAGGLVGGGTGLTNLNASQLTSGTIPIAQLPASVAFLNSNQTFTGTNIFAALGNFADGIILESANGFHQNSSGPFYVDAPGLVGGRFVVETNGNVGVGTYYTPNAMFEVNGSVLLDNGVEILGNNGFDLASGGKLSVDAGGSPGGRFVILTHGNVGLGIANPTATLHVNGTNGFEQSSVGRFLIGIIP